MHQITDLNIYYLKLLNLIESDIDTMISEPDITKRSPKVILEYLKMAGTCQEQLKTNEVNSLDDWNTLSPETRAKILDLIEKDVHASRK